MAPSSADASMIDVAITWVATILFATGPPIWTLRMDHLVALLGKEAEKPQVCAAVLHKAQSRLASM